VAAGGLVAFRFFVRPCCTFVVRKPRTNASSFFAKKRDTLLSCIGGFSGIENMAKTIRFAFGF
jgi:hypothetical protein